MILFFSKLLIEINYILLIRFFDDIRQSELEKLSFMYTNPHEYAAIEKRVADLYKEHEKELLEVTTMCSLASFMCERLEYLYLYLS